MDGYTISRSAMAAAVSVHVVRDYGALRGLAQPAQRAAYRGAGGRHGQGSGGRNFGVKRTTLIETRARVGSLPELIRCRRIGVPEDVARVASDRSDCISGAKGCVDSGVTL